MLWSLPIVGAILGWLTNWVAVKMLFRPRNPIKILWWKIQGLIPSRKEALAASIASTIDDKLIADTDFEAAFKDERVTKSVKKAVSDYVKEVIDKDLRPAVRAAKFMGVGSWMDKLEGVVTSQVMSALPKMTGKMSKKLKSTLDLKQMIAEKIKQFSDVELEAVIMDIAAKELRAIEFWGLVIGAVVGGAQWLFLSLV